jgi:hypothetical protein
MEVEDRKKIIKTALINSFVDDYKAYKTTIEFINNDLKKSKIKFKYKYNDFCVEFLDMTLKNIENFDIFTAEGYSQFYINFWQFNLYNLQCMLNLKLDELGYKFEDFYKNSDIKQKVNKKYIIDIKGIKNENKKNK